MPPSRSPVRLLRLGLPILLACALPGCSKKKGPTYSDRVVGAMREGHAMDARGDMQAIANALTSFVASDGNLPEAQDMPGLVSALEPTWLRVVPRTDPWGTEYKYAADESGWSLRSAGKDVKFGDDDDLVMQNGQITQLPKSYAPMAPDGGATDAYGGGK
jgi:hypothetical protein